MFLIAALTVLCTGAIKGWRYAELQKRIAIYTREENSLLVEYRRGLRIPSNCGNYRREYEACLAVAAERRRLIEECERELRHIW
jgi:hypothetical protein